MLEDNFDETEMPDENDIEVPQETSALAQAPIAGQESSEETIEKKAANVTLETLQAVIDEIAETKSEAAKAVLIAKVAKKTGAPRKVIEEQVRESVKQNQSGGINPGRSRPRPGSWLPSAISWILPIMTARSST